MALLSKDLLTADQLDAVTRLYEHDHTLMVAKMGGGKTITTLTAISELLRDGVLTNVLIIAPLKVCKTVWAQEALKWAHTEDITISLCVGDEKTRRMALNESSQITVINFENSPWLFKTMQARCWWDGLVVDEISKLKNSGGTQFRVLRPRLNDFKWRVGLTGTPVSEDWEGLFGQMLVVDGGKALGTNKLKFLQEYFYSIDFNQYTWALKTGSVGRISNAIDSAVYVMPDYRDQLPPIEYHTVEVDLPATVRTVYDTLKKDMVVDVTTGGEIVADNAAVLVGKLQQVAGGFVYGEDREPEFLDSFRIDKAVELCSAGDNVLLVYWFQADLDRLREAFKRNGIPCLIMADEKDAGAVVEQWNSSKGTGQVLMLHPRSAGHGLNLAAGGSRVVWYAPQWSRDLWEQTNARLWRRGQTDSVIVQTIIASDTVDSVVMARVDDKADYERQFAEYFEGNAKNVRKNARRQAIKNKIAARGA